MHPGFSLSTTNLGKCYHLYDQPLDRFKELLWGRRLHQEFWALSGVTVSVPQGSSLGIIGENGAGKSTLLKLIAGVLTPTAGSVTVEGRVASIIELGMGFHPEFRGRENLFVGGALLGLSRRQIEAKVSEIEAFSELGSFLDRPLKSYSTGMAMRLAFSLAVSIAPDLLIVDEALAVGDGHFQKKCVDRIRTFQEQGGSLLFCSHSLYTVSLLCQEALWLRAGAVEAYGRANQVIAAYEAYLNAKERRHPETPDHTPYTGGEFTEVSLRGGSEHSTGLTVRRGSTLTVQLRWKSDSHTRPFHLGVAIDRIDNLTCFVTSTLKDHLPVFTGKTDYAATVCFPALPLTNGSFRIVVFLLDEHGVYVYDQKAVEPTVTVAAEEKEWGICYVDHIWTTSE